MECMRASGRNGIITSLKGCPFCGRKGTFANHILRPYFTTMVSSPRPNGGGKSPRSVRDAANPKSPPKQRLAKKTKAKKKMPKKAKAKKLAKLKEWTNRIRALKSAKSKAAPRRSQ